MRFQGDFELKERLEAVKGATRALARYIVLIILHSSPFLPLHNHQQSPYTFLRAVLGGGGGLPLPLFSFLSLSVFLSYDIKILFFVPIYISNSFWNFIFSLYRKLHDLRSQYCSATLSGFGNSI